TETWFLACSSLVSRSNPFQLKIVPGVLTGSSLLAYNVEQGGAAPEISPQLRLPGLDGVLVGRGPDIEDGSALAYPSSNCAEGALEYRFAGSPSGGCERADIAIPRLAPGPVTSTLRVFLHLIVIGHDRARHNRQRRQG